MSPSVIRVESQLLEVIRGEIFTPDAVAYLTDRVQEALKRLSKGPRGGHRDRQAVERDLAQALKERDHVKDAIRRGLAGAITQEMLEDIETRLRTLQKQLDATQTPEYGSCSVVGTALATAVEGRLRQLDKILDQDVERARRLLRDLVGEIVLRPSSGGLVAELRGNVEGLLALEGALPAGLTGNLGSGGRI